jgi:protein transport protein SEC61 subunit gamma-like protein
MEEKPTRTHKIKAFCEECRRVLKVTKKPSNIEFKTIVKVSGMGMAIIGVVGFVIHIIRELMR